MELKLDGTIRSLTEVTRRKKEQDTAQGRIVVKNEEGDTVTLVAGTDILNGFNPEDTVVITVTRSQKTLAESVEGDK